MRKHLNRKGFTMGEVLIVVAIIVVLAGVGFIALMSHLRNMHQLEMDGHAKEIFVAAQNHLSMAKSQDYMGVSNDRDFGVVSTLTFTDGDGAETGKDEGKGIYYIVVKNAAAVEGNGASLLEQMLPFASVDETARAKGSYIIRYQKDPGVILDVFYSDPGDTRYAYELKGSDYATLMSAEYHGESAEQREKRRKYGTDNKGVVGWYGGGVEGVPAGEKLNAPGLEIVNGDTLEVRVTNYNRGVNEGKNVLNLVVKCEGASIQIPLLDKNGQFVDDGSDADRRQKTGDTDTYTVVLDDVTAADLHFAQLYTQFAATSTVGTVVPGEDITVYAVAYNADKITNVAQSQEMITNSLFAYDTEDNSAATVKIASIRHLLNLDYTISGVNVNITGADQISDLIWNDPDHDNVDFLDNTHGASTRIYPYNAGGASVPSEAGSYMPVEPKSSLISYQGRAGSNRITGIVVTDEGKSIGNAGLFSTLSCNVSDLELIDFKITSKSGNAGALAGATSGSPTITAVLVHNSKTGGVKPVGADKTATSGADIGYKIESTTAAAGGLVGSMNGGTVNMCAAAVYVKGATEAGGLIGSAASGSAVTSSYSGGHTEDAQYVGATEADPTLTVVNVIVTQDSGYAGGLIGYATTTNVTNCYSTSSAAPLAGKKATVGGLVGSASGGTITSCYSIGYVAPGEGGTASSFIGLSSGTNFAGTNMFLESGEYNNSAYESVSNVTAASAGVGSDIIVPDNQQGNAYPYDKKLLLDHGKTVNGKQIVGYCFKNISQLVGASFSVSTSDAGLAAFRKSFLESHYGDWQLPGMIKLDYKLVNEDTLYLEIALPASLVESSGGMFTMAVTGAASTNTRMFVIKAAADDAKTKIASLTLQKEGYVDNNKALQKSADSQVSSLQTRLAARFKPISKATVDGKDYYHIRITLDDITTSTGHFAQLFACDATNTDKNLWPGENITVRVAGGECSFSDLNTLDYWDKLSQDDKDKIADKNFNWCAKADNSLYFGWNDYWHKDDAYKDTENNLHKRYDDNHLAYVDDLTSTTVYIKNLRHLQNLDSSTSYANISGIAATRAELRNDIDYNAETTRFPGYKKIYNYQGTKQPVENTFIGIYNPGLTFLSGKYHQTIVDDYHYTYPEKSGKLVNFKISGPDYNYTTIYQLGETTADTENTFGRNNAGLFRYVKARATTETEKTLTIADLYLKDLTVSGSDYVGAVVASNHGTVKLDTVLVAGEKGSVVATSNTATSSIAGGLVGYSGSQSGYRASKLDIINSAASTLITSNGGPAGGLLGRQNGGTVQIYASYVGGRTGYYALNDDNDYVYVGGEYYQGSTADPGEVTVVVEGVNVKYDTGRWNIISAGGAAGGLIGEITSGTTGIEKSFNTASVFSGGSNKAGGIAGVAKGTFAKLSGLKDANDNAISTSSKVLELVYTVAPVANVNRNVKSGKTFPYVPAAGKGGAIFGERSETTVTGIENLYYQADFYSEVEFNDAQTATNISYLGSGGDVSTVTLASYYADKSAAGAAIIGLYSNQDENLEVSTTAYDDYLTTTSAGVENSQEYPFSIWTKFAFETDDTAQITHFYGDWQPVKREKSEKFVFYFMKELPSDSSATTTVYEDFYTLTDTNGNGTEAQLQAQNERWMAIQTIPYVETELAIPTLPYIPGYDYGSKSYAPGSGKAYAFDSGEELASTEDHYVWTLYVGDQRTPLKAMSTRSTAEAAKYSALGNGIILPEQYLKDALAAVEGTDNYPTLTLVAHYNKLDDQYTVTLMDYDPTRTEEGGTPEYERLSLQVLNKADYTDGITFGKVKAKGDLQIPRRNRPNYTFLGWYTQDTDTKIYGYTNGQIELVNADYAITKDTVLIAKYRPVEYGTIEIDFIMDGSGLVLAPTYSLQYEKETTFDMDIPLPSDANMKGIRITQGTGTTQTPDASFVKVSEDSDYISAIHIKYTGSENRHYYVYVQTTENAVAYVVRCKMMDTEGTGGIVTLAALGGAYKAGSDALLDPYAGQNLLLLTSGGGNLNAETYIQAITIPGFEYNGENDVIEVTSSTTGYGLPDGNTITADGETYSIGYVLTLSYDRIKYTLSYTNTETSIRSKKIAYGDNIVIPADPSYSGWQFDYWSYKEGENDVRATAQTLMPARDLALKANWKAAKTDFTVAFHLQNDVKDESNYSIVESVRVEQGALPGATINTLTAGATTISISFNGSDTFTRNYTGAGGLGFDADVKDEMQFYHVDHYSMSDTEIKQDGSTVINVYFTRNTYTLRFDVGFSQMTGNAGTNITWSYKLRTPAYSDVTPVYGKFGENYLELTKEGDQWGLSTYEWIPYNGERFSVATDENGEQYAPNGTSMVKIVKRTTYSTADTYYKYTKTEKSYEELTETEYANLKGIRNHNFIQIYWNNNNNKWQRQGNHNYGGTRFIQESVNGAQEYSGTPYYKANNDDFTTTATGNNTFGSFGKLTDDNGNEYYIELINNPVTKWYYEGTDVEYIGTCYKKGGANAHWGYTGGTDLFEVEERNPGDWGYYDKSQPATFQEYNSDLYIEGWVSNRPNDTTTTYYVSNITNSTSNDGGYGAFLSAGHVNLGSTNPFGAYKAYDVPENNVPGSGNKRGYTIYYTDVTDLYGANISSKWPILPSRVNNNNTNYAFIGWLTNNQSYYCSVLNNYSSMKGTYENLVKDILLVNGSAIKAQDGVAHELHCRYNEPVRTYVYRLYIWDYDREDFILRQNRGEFVITGGTGSVPSGQTEIEIPGYDVTIKVKGNTDHGPTRENETTEYLRNRWVNELNANHYNNGRYGNKQKDAYQQYHISLIQLQGEYPDGVDGMIMNYYYYPSKRPLVLKFVKDGKRPEDWKTINKDDLIYGASGTTIQGYMPTDTEVLAALPENERGKYDFEGWYDNKLCADGQYAFDETMPNGQLILYAKLTHKPVTVKFYKEDGTTEYTALSISSLAYGSTLETYLGSGAYVLPDYDSTDGKFTFEFLYWKDKESGEEWVRSDKVEDDLELIPVFERVANPEATSVTVYFLKYDKNKGEDLSKYTNYKTDSSLWAKEKATRSTYYGSEDPILVGKLYSEPAANINGYYPIRLNRSCKVQADGASEIVHFYEAPVPWSFKVEYYIQLQNIENPTWASATTETAVPILIYTDPNPHTTTGKFALFGYSVKEGMMPWAAQYEFLRYKYNGTEVPGNSPFVMLKDDPDSEEINVLKVYLVPDSDAIFIEDHTATYDGDDHAGDNDEYSSENENLAKSPLWVPAGAKVTVNYLYYDMSDPTNPKEVDEVIDAKTYGVRAYIIVTYGGKDYLVWESEDTGDNKPPLHLYINRRIVFLYSAYGRPNQATASGPVLFDHDVLTAKYVYTKPSEGPANDAQVELAFLLDRLGLSEDEIGFAKTADEAAMNYIWSANAFRRMSGKSPNVFSYTVDADVAGNYNFYSMFGELYIP